MPDPKNDRLIADKAKMLIAHRDANWSTGCELVLRDAREAGLDPDLLELVALHLPSWVVLQLAAVPGRKIPLVHYAKSVMCPRWNGGA